MKHKILIFGKNGFIAKELAIFYSNKSKKLKFISKKEIDLTSSKSSKNLKKIDFMSTIIFLSALTPDKGKDIDTFEKNISMIRNFFNFFNTDFISHFIYISSDAVYSLDKKNISEKTKPSPTDLYASMHLTREIFIKTKIHKNKLTILRPTLIYGKNDTHNSYGPNRLAKSTLQQNKINLFGNGEDERDHIFVKDFVAILDKIIEIKKFGTFNIATGKSISFIKIAKIIKRKIRPNVKIQFIKNNGKITKRKFNIKKLRSVIGSYKFKDIKSGLKEYF